MPYNRIYCSYYFERSLITQESAYKIMLKEKSDDTNLYIEYEYLSFSVSLYSSIFYLFISGSPCVCVCVCMYIYTPRDRKRRETKGNKPKR